MAWLSQLQPGFGYVLCRILWTFVTLASRYKPFELPAWKIAVRSSSQLGKHHHHKNNKQPKASGENSAWNRSEITLPAVLPRPQAGTDRYPPVVSTSGRKCLISPLRNPCIQKIFFKKKKVGDYPCGSSVTAVENVPLRQRQEQRRHVAASSSAYPVSTEGELCLVLKLLLLLLPPIQSDTKNKKSRCLLTDHLAVSPYWSRCQFHNLG